MTDNIFIFKNLMREIFMIGCYVYNFNCLFFVFSYLLSSSNQSKVLSIVSEGLAHDSYTVSISENSRICASLITRQVLLASQLPCPTMRSYILLFSAARLYRKRCQGRLKKHVADLCLLSGVCGEAVLHYRTSLEMLRAANDVLWLAGDQLYYSINTHLAPVTPFTSILLLICLSV